MAEEVLRAGAGEVGGEQTPGFEGMETLAQAIELGMCRMYVCSYMCVCMWLMILQCWLGCR